MALEVVTSFNAGRGIERGVGVSYCIGWLVSMGAGWGSGYVIGSGSSVCDAVTGTDASSTLHQYRSEAVNLLCDQRTYSGKLTLYIGERTRPVVAGGGRVT